MYQYRTKEMYNFELLWYDAGRTGRCLLEKFTLRFLASTQSLEKLHLMQAPRGIPLETETGTKSPAAQLEDYQTWARHGHRYRQI